MDRRGLLGMALAFPAHSTWVEERWPNRPIVLVEGYPPGGVTDLVSRAVAGTMARQLGVPVIVENRPGAATTVSTNFAVRAKPDGNTLFMGTSTLAINRTLQPQLTAYDPRKDFTPIGTVFRTPFVLQVNPALPVTAVEDLIAYCKAYPGQVLFGSPGIGSVSHLCLELFRTRMNIDVVHVPYRSGSEAVLDLRRGRIHATFQAVEEALATLAEGSTRGLAVTSGGRLERLPLLLPVSNIIGDFEVYFWQGLFAPAGLPRLMQMRIAAALRVATESMTIRQGMSDLGIEMISGDENALQALLEAEVERWGDVIHAAEIRVE
jgi:tripartite-type tricarboxylate transporter receptor subunit TctC